jgi:ABC-type nickel/cobalt efflux system permease component RcnA
VTFRDLTYPERIGWHEIVLRAGTGVRLSHSDAPDTSVSDELRQYPSDALTNPVRMTSASTEVERAPGAGAHATSASSTAIPSVKAGDLLANLVGGNLSVLGAILSLLVAAGLGAAHAVSPGHGKTLVAAYLIGGRGSLRQAIWLGGTVAVTHTLGVFVLGAITLVATEALLPERVISLLSLGSGLLVIGLGVSLLAKHWRAQHAPPHPEGHEHAHPHEHPHAHAHPSHADTGVGDHAHRHTDAPPLSRAGIATLGLVGGIVPSASALLVLLVAMTTGRLVFGLALIVSFGIGMALVLTLVSAAVLMLRDRIDGGSARWASHPAIAVAARLVPVGSALVVLVMGVVLSVGAATTLG